MEYTFEENLYTYHVKDDYFIKMGKDKYLMENKENGGSRPNYYSVKDKVTDTGIDTGILWMIPLSTRIVKYKDIMEKKIAKRGTCYNIVIGKYSGIENAFLIQNMFPVLPKYIDHIHTVKNLQVEVHKSIRREIDICIVEVFKLLEHGIQLPFTKIKELYELQFDEGKADSYKSLNISTKKMVVNINLGEIFDFHSIITTNNGLLSVSEVNYEQIGKQKVIATVKDKFNQTKEVYIELMIIQPHENVQASD